MSDQALSQQLMSQLTPLLQPGSRVWVGFSGGLDSSVLLHALAQQQDLAGRLCALHVHHGLSPHASDWAGHCAAVCATLNIPLYCEKVTVIPDGSIEEAARQARYQAFSRHLRQGDLLLLAHHADDQNETFFQRLFRGAGLSGLGAMPAARPLLPGVMLLRPLLQHPRALLEAYARQHELRWIEDESNLDERYERNWWRQRLLPQVFARFPGKQVALQRSIARLQQDQQVLQQLLSPYTEACLQPVRWPLTASVACDLNALARQPAALQPYILRDWLERLGMRVPSEQWLTTLQQEVIAAAGDARPQLVLGRYTVRRFRQALYLVQEHPPAQALPLLLHGAEAWGWSGGTLTAETGAGGLKPGQYQLLPALAVRGKTLRAAGRPAKTVKALFQEAAIPVWLRDHWPALVCDGELVALAGLATAQDWWCEDEQALTLSWQKTELFTDSVA